MSKETPLVILVASDSFKESLSAREACGAIAEGARRAWAECEAIENPMADGGEGTVDAMVAATNGEYVDVSVTGPLGKPVNARYGILGDGDTAVIEMAAASGLMLVPVEERNPGITTTRGTGELIRHALDHGTNRLVVAIGGSATNDGGAGMAQALGYRLTDAKGGELAAGGLALNNLARIDSSDVHPRLREVTVDIACDVNNPLCGPNGASRVYGPQKGADSTMVEKLDVALAHFASVVESELGLEVLEVPGAGAAGGLGAGLMAFVGGQLRPGFQLIAETCRLEEKMGRADLVITGEGRLDSQTLYGKTPAGVAGMANKRGIPAIAFAGSLGPGYRDLYDAGVTAMYSICPGPISEAEAKERASELLMNATESIMRIIKKAPPSNFV